MPGWRTRLGELDQALKDLPAERADENASLDCRVHLALLRHYKKDPPSPAKRLRGAALTLDDFPSLSTLSSSGSFTRVELVKPASSLTGDNTNGAGAVYVMKTVDRRWAYRMRAHQHVSHELMVLRLARADDGQGRIPRLVASFLSPTSFHLVLSHSAGGDLGLVLEQNAEASTPGREKGLPEEWVLGWMAELVDAVDWLHGRGWAHRDIKPQNLLLDAAGHLELTDFGSSAPLTPGTTAIARKHCRVLLGTPDYIAPEVLKHAERVYQEEEDDEEDEGGAFGAHADARRRIDEDERAYGAEVDWWACGIAAFELLSGITPFFAEEISETYERIVHWQDHLWFPPESTISAAARAVISTLLVAADRRPTASSIKPLAWFSSIEWDGLRKTPPAYTPLPFAAPSAACDSFARSHRSSAQSFNFTSFFSSPGLSILRPSPRTTGAAQTEESEYWAAREWGGLTTLPAPDAFDAPASPYAPPTAAQPRATSAPHAAAAFSTPARPLSRLAHLATGTGTGTGTGTPRSGGSSARARRGVSGMDAWREMQEHAWTVGRSARKPAPAPAPRPVRECGGTPRITGLQRRQEEVVLQLDRIDEKYRGLFELAAREVVAAPGSEK